MKSAICNFSEIAPLKKVLMHRPGDEFLNLTPNTLERLLFDDIPYLKIAQQEHDAYANALRAEGVEVLYLEDLVAQALDAGGMMVRKEFLRNTVDFLNRKYGYEAFKLEIRDSYSNMLEKVSEHMELVENALLALKESGIEARAVATRGGTDGANLSFMGLPCPNIFAGGHNFHGKLEYVPLESMEKASKVILNIIGLFAE